MGRQGRINIAHPQQVHLSRHEDEWHVDKLKVHLQQMQDKGWNMNDTLIHQRCSPIAYAIKCHARQMVQALIQNGADIWQVNKAGESLMHIALKFWKCRCHDVVALSRYAI